MLRQQDGDNKFVVIEQWQSVKAHQQSLANFPTDEMQAAMALFGAPPMVPLIKRLHQFNGAGVSIVDIHYTHRY